MLLELPPIPAPYIAKTSQPVIFRPGRGMEPDRVE
jgi:hypothetical protein